MIFTGVLFLFRFLPLFLICMFLAPGRMKNVILFLGSLLFYAWGEPFYCILLLGSILVNYCLGLVIGHVKAGKRLFPLIAAIVLNVGMLGYFKYSDSFLTLLGNSTDSEIGTLPVGISVWTLLSISYLVRVYRGEVKARKNILELGMYVSLFPVAFVGPVVDYRDMEEQLGYRKMTAAGVADGLKKLCFGVAKKALLADELASLWQTVLAKDLGTISLFTAWIGIIALGLEVYFTFSGFSDIAIGLLEICGFTVSDNFDHPFMAASVTEFCQRWHISLGKWFKEYVYLPICGKREKLGPKLLGALICMALAGMWYGTGLHFLLWGLWIGFFLVLEKLFLERVLEGLVRPMGMIYNFLVISFGWVLFSFSRFEDIINYTKGLVGFDRIIDYDYLFLLQEYWVVLTLAGLCATPIFSHFAKRLKSTGNGWDTALYRLGEKVVPPVLLLLSIACIVDAFVTPFLHFTW